MAAHAYWRCYITLNNGSGDKSSLAELQFRTVAGVPQVPTGGTAIASSSSDGTPASAFDNTTSEWAALKSSPYPYIGYHFSSPIIPVQISIMAPGSGVLDRSPKDFTIDYSDDGTTWTTSDTIIGQISWTTNEVRVFAVTPNGTLAGNITESLNITDWSIVATDIKTGLKAGSEFVSGTTYSFSCYSNLCNITISPKINYAWTASLVVALNDYCVPSVPDTTPKLYKATNIGSSPNHTGSTEPTWPSSGTVADGDITWTYIADLVDPITIGPKIPA